MPKAYLRVFGCQMNKLDGEIVRSRLMEAGYEIVREPEEADVILFETCSVREHAEQRALSRIGSTKALHKRRPDLVVGVVGCMAQRMGRRLLDTFPHLGLVCGTRAFTEIAALIDQVRLTGEPVVQVPESLPEGFFRRNARHRPSHHRAYVCAMRGCNNSCAYCVVPALRGREVSRPHGDIVAEVEALASDGVKEIILLGQNIDSYGRDLPDGHGLAGLLDRLNALESIVRIRFITSHPKDLSPALPQAMARLDKVCEHLHLPPQSGSDRILKLMGRGYTRARYREIVSGLRDAVPSVGLAGDFIVGFPTETEEDFEQTLSLLSELNFRQCFIFKYSPRPGTRAARLPDDVSAEDKARRHYTLLKTQEQIALQRNRGMIGNVVEILADAPSKKNPARLTGRTRQNDLVLVEAGTELIGQLVSVRITAASPVALYGELAD